MKAVMTNTQGDRVEYEVPDPDPNVAYCPSIFGSAPIKLAERINRYPDTARVSIMFKGGEDIYSIKELKDLLGMCRYPSTNWPMIDNRPLDHAVTRCLYPAPCNCCSANL